ncbi:MAG: aspartate kinase, partial [Bdellovibrionales bacterium]|nr:aspartate kinase [Bdellovibrionales bacterium]
MPRTKSMSLIVQKFGGNTLSNPEQIRSVAQSIKELKAKGNQILVVVSAMGDTTDDLIDLAYNLSNRPHKREFDMLISAGERVSMALLSIALHEIDCDAISFTGSQAGIFTDSSFGQARIVDIKPIRVESELAKGRVAVLAGFQGVNPETKEITTLGRGGSDTTAIALAHHFKAKHCEILKDVPGVYSADPKIVSNAKILPTISFEECRALTFWGAPFLHLRASELALEKKIPIWIKGAHLQGDGTWIKEVTTMYEKSEFLSVTTHSHVRSIHFKNREGSESIQFL